MTSPSSMIPRSAAMAMLAPTTPPPTSSSVSSSLPWSTPSDWDHKTRVYLDEAPGYWQLPACAMTPISTIVRDMSKGCGDGGRLTSYACFCTESRRKARWDISTEIAAQCGGGGSAAAASASMERAVDSGTTTVAAAAAITSPARVAAAAAAAAAATTGPKTSSDLKSSPQEAVNSALGVFEAYCSIGIGHGIYEPSHKPNSGTASQTPGFAEGAASAPSDVPSKGTRGFSGSTRSLALLMRLVLLVRAVALLV